MGHLRRLTLEMSLKPFKRIDEEYIRSVCNQMFEQWKNLSNEADEIAVMLWTSDGSEILDYKGKLEEPFEWANVIGGANVKMKWNKHFDPDGLGLHTRNYPYMEDAPIITYGVYKKIISIIKEVGKEVTGKDIFVGATFDPGPEFAKSSFKYERHQEILVGDSMGEKSMVCCYAKLHADDCFYATYPEGIPEGTLFGTFFAKQAQRFFEDMGLDFLWLSNGFGFGTETWGVHGVLYDGKEFHPELLEKTRKNIETFWDEFGKYFKYPVQVRGTNLTAGIDFATDGVDHSMIYEGNRIQLPPPNSPWAALDGNFGLELAGYMSRMAELPNGSDILFRYYIHDPWWHNSPWIDRYEGQPHDIFMPLAVSRINGNGGVENANYLHFLTVDNSFGEMPDKCPLEITPHLCKCFSIEPNKISPFIWVYPFKEYSNGTSLEKAFFEDWFFISMLNHGIPFNTVLSSDNFVELSENNPTKLNGRVLVTPVPLAHSDLEKALIEYVDCGGTVMLYGSLEKVSDTLIDKLGLKKVSSLKGTFVINDGNDEKSVVIGDLTDGGLNVCANEANPYLKWSLSVEQDSQNRAVASFAEDSGKWLWCRGDDCSRKKGQADDACKVDTTGRSTYPMADIARQLLSKTGFVFDYKKPHANTRNPVVTIHQHDESLWYSGFCPDTRVSVGLSTPLGAPLLIGHEPILENNVSWYNFPRAWQKECRVFVEQEDSTEVFCREAIPVRIDVKRRLEIGGLKNATVRVLCKDFENTFFLLNSTYPFYITQPIEPVKEESVYGPVWRLDNVSGTLMAFDSFKG